MMLIRAIAVEAVDDMNGRFFGHIPDTGPSASPPKQPVGSAETEQTGSNRLYPAIKLRRGKSQYRSLVCCRSDILVPDTVIPA